MGTKFCCNEDRYSQQPSKENENNYNDNNIGYKENILCKINEINNKKSLSLQGNNTIDSDKKIFNKKNKKHNKYDFNYLDYINDMKSSLFEEENDNENENQNSLDNEENNNKIESNINFKANKKKRIKSGENSKDNFYPVVNIKKKKKEKNKYANEFIDVKKIIKKNPNYKNNPLKLKDFNDNKENEFYLINTPKYIGLKNTNSNLVFVKNDIQNIDIKDNIKLIGSKKDLFNKNNYSNKKLKNNDANDEEENINNKYKILYSKYSISHKDSESINPDINITTRNHNVPFDEKITGTKNNSSSIKKAKNEIEVFNYINKDNIIENIHSNNERLIEIYIINQIRKIINFFGDKTKRQEEPRQILNQNKRKNITNNNELNDEAFGYNNHLVKTNSLNNIIKGKEINELSLSFEVINSSKCQTIMNKNKNFCIKFFPNGSVYIGEIKQDKLWGHGKFLNIKNDIITGFFKDNYFHGYNLIEMRQNNSKFEGQFEKNKFNGYGIEQFSDGSTYFGQYKNNEKCGIGTYKWGSGYQFQGEWKNGRPNGLGIFFDNKNRCYEGEWKNGMMNGIGLFKWEDGRKYFGMFNNDKRNGFGIYFWNNPLQIYIGYWVNGLQNGIGKVLTSFKERYYLWENGKMIKKYSSKNDITQQIDKNEINAIKNYQHFFEMNVDDLLTFMLDLQLNSQNYL